MNFLTYSLFLIVMISQTALAQGMDRRRGDFKAGEIAAFRHADKIIKNADNSVTIINPRVETPYGILPLKADAVKICHVFGYMGAFADKLEFKITDNEEMLKLYSTIRSTDPFGINPESDISVSYNVEKSQGRFSAHHFHYASKVVCGSLRDLKI